MIRTIGDKKVFVGIISHLRSENVPKMHAIVGEDVTWVVGNNEKEIYQQNGVKSVIEGGGLCESRNVILDVAQAQGADAAVELSDDLRVIKLAVDKDNKNSKVISFDDAVAIMISACEGLGAKMAGTAPTNNAFFFNPNKPYHTRAFIVGDFITVLDTDLRFDQNLKLKEDYDYTLQHIYKYGSVARCNALLPSFLHRTNAGGACAYRNEKREQKAIRYLKAKWPSHIKDNPRRPNEILIKGV